MLLNPEDHRKYLKCFYIERRNNKLLAVVTNIKIAAVEYLGDDNGPDECTAIAIDPALVAQCVAEIAFNSKLVIVANPMLAYTSIKTTFGYNYPSNAMVQLPEANNFNNWRAWFPDEMPTATHGAMFWQSLLIQALASTSPSGGICFPEFVDVTRPVVVRDGASENWAGLFMPVPENPPIDAATIPNWVA